MTACFGRDLVDAHFRGAIEPADERRLRTHLDGCRRCRRRYEKQLLLAELDPEQLSSDVRLGRALGLAPATARKSAEKGPLLRLVPTVAAGLALAAAVAFIIRPRPGDPNEGFQPRGTVSSIKSSPEGIHVFRTPRGGSTLSNATDTFGRNDDLAFAYDNPRGEAYLMIFGVDEDHHVFWFHPAWSDESQTPRAIPIVPGAGPHELREAIHHRFTGKRLEIHGLFSNAPRSVREVEQALSARDSAFGALEMSQASDHVLAFEVEP